MLFLRAILSGFFIALQAIWANKLRAGLTTFGIIIGIVSVTSMATIIDGVDKAFSNSLKMLGTNVIYVQKWPWSFGPNYKWWEYMNRREMEVDYAEEIDRYSTLATGVSAISGYDGPISSGGKEINPAKIRAVSSSYTKTATVEIEEGRFFSTEDNRIGKRVCVVGQDIVTNLFPRQSAMGKEVKIRGLRYEVIGVLSKQGSFLGLDSFDDQVLIPINTFKRYFGLNRRDVSLQVKFASEEDLVEGQFEIEGIMRRLRKLDPSEKNDFAINKLEVFQQQYESMTILIYAIGIFLTALSLFVGGIGVMNIMFVSVKERTREIGIRKAVGAKPWHIMLQFLIEAVLVCFMAGLIGVLLSTGITKLINEFFVAVLSTKTVILALFICTLTGVLFGIVPAIKASQADPIESLRYE